MLCTRRAEGSGRSGSAYRCLYVISLRFASQTTAPSFHSTAVELGREPASRELLAYCLICGFWTHDHGKIKSHIRQAHRALWDAHGEQAVANCGKAGLVLLKGQSCPCCEKHVHDKRLHPGQCPVLFQILFYDAAHSLTRCRGGPLRRFMPTAARAPLPTATPPSIPASPAPAPHLGGDASSTFSSEPRPLRNISNFCYVNSVISALIPTGILNDHGPASRALHREASGHAAMGPHVLTASFSLRHVTPTWRYDGSQQDASEYLTALFRGLSSFPISRPWETKDPETGSTLDRGGPLLLLPTPVGQDTARLQDLLDAWSGTPAHTALNGQQSLVTVAVARFVEGSQASLYAFRAAPTDQHTAVDSCRSGGIASGLGSVLHISHRRWTTQWTLPLHLEENFG